MGNIAVNGQIIDIFLSYCLENKGDLVAIWIRAGGHK